MVTRHRTVKHTCPTKLRKVVLLLPLLILWKLQVETHWSVWQEGAGRREVRVGVAGVGREAVGEDDLVKSAPSN